MRIAPVLSLLVATTAWAGPRAPAAGGRHIDLPKSELRAVFSRPHCRLRETLFEQIAAVERRYGDNDQRLSPRDVDKAPALVRALVARIHARTGSRTLALDEIRRELPDALTSLAVDAAKSQDRALATFHRQAMTTIVDALRTTYADDVLSGAMTLTAFQDAHGLRRSDAWKQLVAASPRSFADKTTFTLDDSRRAQIAALYADVLAGRLTSARFYTRTGITAKELTRLQVDEPARFPRPPMATERVPLRGLGATTALPPDQVEALAAEWRAHVTTNEVAAGVFYTRHGLTRRSGDALRLAHPALFPAPTSSHAGQRPMDDVVARVVAKKVEAILARDPLTSRGQIAALLDADADLVKRFGAFDYTRYGRIATRYRSLFPNLKTQKARALAIFADELREILAKKPDATPNELTRIMRARYASFRVHLINEIQIAHPGVVPLRARTTAPAPRVVKATLPKGVMDRATRPTAELFALVTRIVPPGTPETSLRAIMSALMVERGLPAFENPSSIEQIVRTHLPGGLQKSEEHAEVTSQIVAEYARTAAVGASEADVLAAVRRDYPTLDRALGRFAVMWRKNVRAYPALASFVDGKGALVLAGRGETLPVRYRGGWSVDRALLSDAALRADLAKRTQYARIPYSLPLLDQMVADLGGRKPLTKTNVLWVSHLLGSTYPLARALRAAGATGPSSIVVGTPYGTNEAVRAAIADDGFDVRVPSLSVEAYKAEVARALKDVVAIARKNQNGILVLDDGGLVAQILHSDPAYANILDDIKIVEQTTQGILLAEERAPKVPIINVARSRSKQAEASLIGRAVAGKLMQALEREGSALVGKRATLLGYGMIGPAIASALTTAGALVTVFDSSPLRTEEAAHAGYVTADKDAALTDAELVVGATGRRSLADDDLRRLPRGAVVASASSKQVEIDVAAAKARSVKVLNGGWPINFDGDVEDIPADEIQLTRAAMFAGAIQAAAVRGNMPSNKRVLPLDEAVDQQILDRFNAARAGKAPGPIGNPDEWQGIVAHVDELARSVTR